MHGGHHPKSNVQRLYTSRKEGGRGLVSVQVTIQDETQNIQEYIRKMTTKRRAARRMSEATEERDR